MGGWQRRVARRRGAPDDAVTVPTAQGRLHAGDALVRHALHQAHVEADLVPFDDLRQETALESASARGFREFEGESARSP